MTGKGPAAGEGRSLAPDGTDILDTAEAGGRAIRGGTLRTFGYVAGSVVTLLSVPLLVRHLGVVDFGRYTTVVSLVAIVAGVTEAGLGAVAVREYSTLAGADRVVFMRNVLGARIALTTAGVAGGVLFAVVAGYGPELVLGAVLAGLGLLVAVVQSTYLVPLNAALRVGTVTLTDFLRTLLTAVLVVALVLGGAGIVAFLAVPLPAAAVLTGLTVLLVRGQVPLMPAFHPARWSRIVRETLPLAVATALGTLYFRMAIVVMSLIATGAQTGYFSTSYRLIEALIAIPALLIGVTFPVLSRAARDDVERLRYAAQRIFEIALIGGVWMSIATALLARPAIAVIGGPEAEPAVAVLHIQAAFLMPLFLNLTWQTMLLTLRMHRAMMHSALAALVAVLALTLILIPPLGARGAAIAVVAGESILVLAEATLLFRARPDLVPRLGVVPRVALAGATALTVALVLDVGEVVRAVLATLIYVGVLLAVRGIPPELRGALLGRAASTSP